MESKSNATTSECVYTNNKAQQMLNFSSNTIIFSYTHTRSHAHIGSYLWFYPWCSGSRGLSPLFTLSKWVGNTSALYEIMFCMRFDVVCFWWQKQKYCFFTAYPTHFVNRYCATVAGATLFYTLTHIDFLSRVRSWTSALTHTLPQSSCIAYCRSALLFAIDILPWVVIVLNSEHDTNVSLYLSFMSFMSPVQYSLYNTSYCSVVFALLLCIRHIATRAIEFLVSHYKQLFSVNNHAVVTESLCGNILHMACIT